MDLLETPGNPIPPDSIVVPIVAADGVTLRVARWSTHKGRGTVSVAIGRSEFIEEYAEVVGKLIARGFDVVVMDWRGQGMSGRETRWVRRGYVSSFSAYRRDLQALEQQILRPFMPQPWFGLAHSMGAAILLDQAHDGESPFERLILSAPMIDLPLRRKTTIRRLAQGVNRLGLGSRLVPGGSERSIFLTRAFENNILTSDRRQYERLKVATTMLPKLAIGAPTIRWLAGAFALMQRFAEPRYAVETLTPILIIAAGADRIVSTAATERFAIRLKAGRCITIPEARHQVIMESDAVTAQFWAAFDAFIPGRPLEEAVASARAPKKRWAADMLKKIAAMGRRPEAPAIPGDVGGQGTPAS